MFSAKRFILHRALNPMLRCRSVPAWHSLSSSFSSGTPCPSSSSLLLFTSSLSSAVFPISTGTCVRMAASSSSSSGNNNNNNNISSSLSQQQRFTSQGQPGGVDVRSSASMVVVDPIKAAQERDRMAREMLEANYPRRSQDELTLVVLRDLVHTVPYTLNIAEQIYTAEAGEKVRGTANAILQNGFDMVNKYLNNYNPASEVSTLNELPVGVVHTMSPHLKKVMECCVAVYRLSGTCFDPAVFPLVKRLLNAMRNPNCNKSDLTLPDGIVERFSLLNSFDIDLEAGTISRKHEEAMLDLGGISKGYTVDYVINRLNEAGFRNVMFEWGGDCRASGVNVQRQQWAVAVTRPPSVEEIEKTAKNNYEEANPPRATQDEEECATGEITAERENEGTGTEKKQKHNSPAKEEPPLMRVIYLDDEAICTSGDYENVTYHPEHGVSSCIFDWKKKRMIEPSNDELAQVSVRCYSAMYADALATASLVKRDPVKVRYMLETYRWNRNRVTDYAAYTRDGERLAHMYEIARESPQRRQDRIAGSLPARVVIIGGGLAGLSAAIEAATCGAQVILLEKSNKLGGNSAKATSGINGWGTRAQALGDVGDSCKWFERDTFLSGIGGQCDPGLVRTLSVKSGEAIAWLSTFGISLTVLSQLGGHSRKRTHRAPDMTDGTPVPIGFTIMRHLENFVRNKMAHHITVMTNVAVTSLMHETKGLPDGSRQARVTGVTYVRSDDKNANPMALPADAVILATGGFSNDRTSQSLLREYAPHLFGTPTTNGTFATGDGVKLARRLGALLVDMDKVQLHPTGLIDPKDPANGTKILGPEALRGSGGVLINKRGERFINELDLRSVVSAAINAQEDEYPGSNGSRFAYCVLNESAVKLFGINALNYYADTLGVFQRVDNIEALAKLIGCELHILRQTLEMYEATSTAKKVCPLTNKMVFPCVLGPQGSFYVAFVTPSIHYTMGGCHISAAAEILQEHHSMHILENHRPVQALFGAGEVTGGVHGRNRLGGNSLLECVVFGRIAGDRAATILQKKDIALSSKEWTAVTIREKRSGEQFGAGSRVLRFNLPGALQRSGLQLGQFIAIRGEWDGQQLIGYYSPITLPDECGTISILARGDKGTLQEWISAMRPGDSVEIKACGGLRIECVPSKKQMLFGRQIIRRFGLIAGGTGIAPMIQIIRAALQRPYVDTIESIRLIYASEEYEELTYRHLLQNYAKENPDKFSCDFVLNNPPEGWTGGVGFVDSSSLKKNLPPPSNDLLIAICGPPAMQRAVKGDLTRMGYKPDMVHTVDEDMEL